MDFLDPKKRRTYNIRLIIGYVLLAIAISLGTVILVYATYGYGINTKTGQIIQNGLLFVDSSPSGAKILLNDKDQSSTTSARLILPSGDYSLTLSKPGYRLWSNKFTLSEHSIQRFNYPLLVPQNLVITSLKTYPSVPPLASQSPDRRWLIVQQPTVNLGQVIFDQYDTNDPTKPPQPLNLPAGSLSSTEGNLSVQEWSSDNDHILLKHSYSNRFDFILMSRANPQTTVNINNHFKVSPSKASLFNKKSDQLYIYSATTKQLRLGNVASASLSAVLREQVIDYKGLLADLAIYVTDKGVPAGQVDVRIYDGVKDYRLETISAASSYVLEAGQYQGHWYYLVPISGQSGLNIFQDPLADIKDPTIARARVSQAISLTSIDQVSFSGKGRFILASDGKTFAGYDFEAKKKIKFELAQASSSTGRWLDEYHLAISLVGGLQIIDYDGTNQQLLTADPYNLGGYLSRDSKRVLSLINAAPAVGVALVNVDLRVADQ